MCVLTARDPGRGQQAVQQLKDEGVETVYKQLDIADRDSVEVCLHSDHDLRHSILIDDYPAVNGLSTENL